MRTRDRCTRRARPGQVVLALATCLPALAAAEPATIAPEVLERALPGSRVPVRVYVAVSPVERAPAEIRAEYREEIESRAELIGNIKESYWPQRTMTREEELELLPRIEASVTAEDRAWIAALRHEIDDLRSEMLRAVDQALKNRADPVLSRVAGDIEALGGTVHGIERVVPAVSATLPGEAVTALAELADVMRVELVRPERALLDTTCPSLGASSWWNGGYDGGAYDVGQIDTGVVSGHPALSGVNVTYTTAGSTDSGDHGTHVAGIMASGDATYTGVAHGLDRLFTGYFDDGVDDPNPAVSTRQQFEELMSFAADKPEVINGSYGSLAYRNEYGSEAMYFDAFIDHYDTMLVFAAGNAGWGTCDDQGFLADNEPVSCTADSDCLGKCLGGSTPDLPCTEDIGCLGGGTCQNRTCLFTSITNQSTAYNAISVANMDDQGTTARSDDVRAGSSSCGPTWGGRRKPDLAAPGTDIASTNAEWDGAGLCGVTGCGETVPIVGGPCHDDFCEKTGTSMAAPHVAAAILLMVEEGNLNPLAQKAVLINNADNWTSSSTPGTGDDGPASGGTWDRSYGWGYMNLQQTWIHSLHKFTGSLEAPDSDLIDDDFRLFAGTLAAASDKATLVWGRRGTHSGTSTPTMHALTGLRLSVYDRDTGAIEGFGATSSENVMQLSGFTGSVVYKVSTTTAIAGATSEPFALATQEGFSAVGYPASFGGGWTGPTSLAGGLSQIVGVSLSNANAIPAHGNSIQLVLPAGGWTLVGGSATQNQGSVAPSGSIPASWSVRPPLDTVAPAITNTSWTPTPTSLQLQIAAQDERDTSVEHRFEVAPGTTGSGAYDTGWSLSGTATIVGLQPNRTYCYFFSARDGDFPATLEATHRHSSYGLNYQNTLSRNVVVTNTPNTVAQNVCMQTLAMTPSSVSAVVEGSDAVRVSWSANGNPAGTRYFVQELESGITSGFVTTTEWLDTNVPCGSNRVYVVYAFNDSPWDVASGFAVGGVTLPNGDIDLDGVSDCSDTCVTTFNPGQGPAAFGQTIVAPDKTRFAWPVSATWRMLTGGDAQTLDAGYVSDFGLDGVGTEFPDSTPGPGGLWWYLVAPDCASSSWSGGGPGELPGARDAALP